MKQKKNKLTIDKKSRERLADDVADIIVVRIIAFVIAAVIVIAIVTLFLFAIDGMLVNANCEPIYEYASNFSSADGTLTGYTC